MSNGDKTVKNKNILKLARQIKTTGRLNTKDLEAAKAALPKMSPGERKARFGEMDDFQNMVQNKLKAGMGELFSTAPSAIFRQTLTKDRIQSPRQRQLRDDGTKPVLDSKGNIVKNLRQKATNKMSGGLQDVDVVDLTTEMEVNE